MQASQEELRSANEELQSTNEELTPSKEEMQSTARLPALRGGSPARDGRDDVSYARSRQPKDKDGSSK